jgi:hypothetical protein
VSTHRPGLARTDRDAAAHKSPNPAFLAKHNPQLVRDCDQDERLSCGILSHYFVWSGR